MDGSLRPLHQLARDPQRDDVSPPLNPWVTPSKSRPRAPAWCWHFRGEEPEAATARFAKIIARALRDAGMVIYTGLHQTPEQIVETVIQEDADAVGLSILSGAHMALVPRVIDPLAEQGIDDVSVTVGGTIPAEDIAALERLGVAAVFTPDASTERVVEFMGTVGRSR
ncbi:MAG TPA: cobalamin B12-binding domain-containing protein [Solirubrobacteraceae bacterium]